MKNPTEDESLPHFKGFTAESLTFFRDLAKNQEKAWFDANKSVYQRAVRGPLASLVQDLSERLEDEGLPLRGDPKRSIFRINRDVRFSKDKSPYKTNGGASLSRNLDKLAPGLLYFHLDPKQSFIAAGFYMPDAAVLGKMRTALCERTAEWLEVEKALAKHELVLRSEEALVKLPRGFENAPAEVHKVLKFKSWLLGRDLSTKSLYSPKLVEEIVQFALEAEPLLRFGWSAIDAE